MNKIHKSLITLLFATLLPFTAFAWSTHLIAIDPGHGGSDPGALGPSAPHEGELALRCGLQVRD